MMAEAQRVRSRRTPAPTVNGWLLDVESEDTEESEADPYWGRLAEERVDYDSEDLDFDRALFYF